MATMSQTTTAASETASNAQAMLRAKAERLRHEAAGDANRAPGLLAWAEIYENMANDLATHQPDEAVIEESRQANRSVSVSFAPEDMVSRWQDAGEDATPEAQKAAKAAGQSLLALLDRVGRGDRGKLGDSFGLWPYDQDPNL